jgi:hypothetical protein
MAERHAGLGTVRRSGIPTIEIVTGYAALAAQPVTIFGIELIAGDAADAVLAVRTRVDGDPLVCLHARAGGVASFVPAAPTVIRDPLQIYVSGADAVGAIAYR